MIKPKQLTTIAASAIAITCIQIFPNHLPLYAQRPAKTSQPVPRIIYVPPNLKTPLFSRGSGSRSGCAETSLAESKIVTLLTPKSYVGQTISARPTVFWYLFKTSAQPIKITLMEPGVIKPLYEQQINSPQAGIGQLQIPIELTVGKKYSWSITLICNQKRPSLNPFFSSWIERVSTTSTLENNLTATTSLRDRALIFAQAGLWYDTLTYISQAKTANPQDPTLQTDFLSLLKQIGLTEIIRN
ncbi:DUF928 domain-containing protein [Calothrix sp. FACHB-156]|nr:DUF928 domain-containing protein [Calothrix sp. FACHB-156]